MSTTTDLTTLKINYLTQAQYDAAKTGGEINQNELYFTPGANIPQPSSTVPEGVSGNITSAGTATTYSRSDHVHLVDSSAITTAIGGAPATETYVDNHKPYMHASSSISSLSTVNGTWTAPYDGFFLMVCRANTTSGAGYVGIQDTTASRYVLMMTQTTAGGYFTGCFPVRKGNSYKTVGMTNATVQVAHVYYFRSDSDDN